MRGYQEKSEYTERKMQTLFILPFLKNFNKIKSCQEISENTKNWENYFFSEREVPRIIGKSGKLGKYKILIFLLFPFTTCPLL